MESWTVGDRSGKLVEYGFDKSNYEVVEGGDVIGFVEYDVLDRRWYAKDHNGWTRGFAKLGVAVAELIRHDEAIAL